MRYSMVLLHHIRYKKDKDSTRPHSTTGISISAPSYMSDYLNTLCNY